MLPLFLLYNIRNMFCDKEAGMITNSYLKMFYEYPDRDTSINQLLEFLRFKHPKFLSNIKENVPQFDLLTEDEKNFLIVASALIEYCLSDMQVAIPNWINDDFLRFKKPFFYNRRLTDRDKEHLLRESPEAFKKRNVYFLLEGLKRV